MKENKNTPGGINKKSAHVFKGPNTGTDKINKEKPKKDLGPKKEVVVIKKDADINVDAVKTEDSIDKSTPKTETYDINKIKSRQEVVKNRQAEIAPLLGDPNNKNLIKEYDELIKESLSIEKRLNEVEVETPELEQATKEVDIEDKKIIIETTAEKKTPEEEKIVVVKEKEIKNEKEKTAENTENKKIELELDKNLEIARSKYIEEYKKCKKESDKENLITKTKNKILNIFRSKENKINTKVEDFFTKELEESKKAYDKARIEKGNYMYEGKKVELEKAGLEGEDLKNALINYKATEILAKTIIEERQKLIDMKAEGSPIKPASWKKLIDWYMNIKPRWKRVALSTMIFLPLAGVGAVGAAAFSSGIVATAGLAAVKFGTSMAIGAGVGQLAKGIDWAKRGSDLKFKEKQIEDKQKLRENFAEGKIDLKQYEKQMAVYEEEERKRNRNRMITKGVVGAALAITAGFVAYDAMGHGVEHLKGIHNSVDAVTGPDVSNHLNTPNIIEHANVEATADHGQGAISTLRELQHNLKIEYGNDLNNAPVSVKHILNTDAHKLAQEYGMYKPGQDAESAFIKSGSSFRVDSHGNLTYHAVGIKNDLILERGTDVKADNLYEGRMSDTDHSGVKESFKAPDQVDMETGRPIIVPHDTNGDIINLDNDQFKVPEQVDMETGKPIVNTLENGDKTQGIKLDNNENIIPKNSNLSSNIEAKNLKVIDNLSPEVLEKAHTTLNENIKHIFPTDKLMHEWDNVKNISAEKLLELSDKGELKPELQSLADHIRNLEKVTGLRPQGVSLINPEPETISHFLNHTTEEVVKNGRIDEIKVPESVLPVQESTNLNHTDNNILTGTKHLETISFNEHGSSIKMKFNYDVGGNVRGYNIDGSYVGGGDMSLHYNLDNIPGQQRSIAIMQLRQLNLSTELLSKIPKGTLEYEFMHNSVSQTQENIIRQFGKNVIKPEDLIIKK
jgi:hypothetical protein